MIKLTRTKKQRIMVYMKNLNVTIDEETWRAARRLAAEKDTSVSALVRAALRAATQVEADEKARQSRAEREDLVKLFESVAFEWGAGRIDREGLHER